MDVGELTQADEVDITFMAGTLGMRLDERGDYRCVPVSIVTSLEPNGQAALAGVEIGCTVVGINGERCAPEFFVCQPRHLVFVEVASF